MKPQDIILCEDNIMENNMDVTDVTLSQQPESDSTDNEKKCGEEKNTRNQIIDKMKILLQSPIDIVKDDFEGLKQQYYKQRKIEIETAHKEYENKSAEERGDFLLPHDELEQELKELLQQFKEKKAAYIEADIKEKEINLARKQAIIDEIKSYLNDSDNIGKHYNDFKELQREFKEIVNVPATEVSGLWKQFQVCSENFYDLLKIHKELRDYDFKKNLEQKTSICEQAESLSKSQDIIEAFKILQNLHEEWRGIGPVSKELREDIWNRFKEVSTEINKRYQQHFEAIKAVETANEQAKVLLCEKIEEIDFNALQSFVLWEEKTKEVIDIQQEWKKIGFASRKVNTSLFERFRKACDQFFTAKAEYYKSVKDSMAINLEKKKSLCEQAEALKESTDWKVTADKLTKLQQEWRQIGSVPRKYSDTIWKRFTDACDYFFERRKSEFSTKRNEEQENLQAKKAVIEKLTTIDETIERNEGISLVKALMTEWNSIGHVPFKEKDKLRKQYQDAVDTHFKRWNVKENRNRLDAYNNTIQEMASSEQAESKLYRERERLVKAYEAVKNDLQTYQNNIGFLSIASKSGNKMVQELERKIAKLQDDMQMLMQKINIIDEKLR